jgi:hypothetical protein
VLIRLKAIGKKDLAGLIEAAWRREATRKILAERDG